MRPSLSKSPLYRRIGKALLGPQLSTQFRRWEEERQVARRRREIGDRSVMSYDRALAWAKRYSKPEGGISQTSARLSPYPEVTGYFIPTLFEFGERELALHHARWLRAQQQKDGAILGPDGSPYTFDTAQALRGFNAAFEDDATFDVAIRKAADFLCSQILPSGEITTPLADSYIWTNGRRLPHSYLLYILPPLFEAARLLGHPSWREAAQRAFDDSLRHPDLLNPDQLSHFFGYVIEALVDLGEVDRARAAVAELFQSLRADGSLPAYPKMKWTCSVGNIQFALIAYKLGLREEAERLYRWAEGMQEPSGGFLGSYGRGADYSANEEISWAVKYFLNATLWRVKTGFNAEVSLHPDTLDANDPRLIALLQTLGDLNGKKVLDLGCGKGRFGKAILSRYPNCKLWGIDCSEAMLSGVGGAFPTRVGSLLHLPFPPDSFDVVYAVESFEHGLNPRGALREVQRVLRVNGNLVILEKHPDELGKIFINPWEIWISPSTVSQWGDASFETVSIKNLYSPPPVRLRFFLWHARRLSKTSYRYPVDHPYRCRGCHCRLTPFGECPSCNNTYLTEQGYPNFIRLESPSKANEWQKGLYDSFSPKIGSTEVASLGESADITLTYRRISKEIKRLGIGKNDRVLDIGCSTGGRAHEIEKATRAFIYGIDISQNSIRIAQSQASPNCHFSVSSAEILPFCDDYFDTVICLDVLEHLDLPELAVKEVTRVLKPGGHALYHVPVKDIAFTLDGWMNRFRKEKWEEHLREIGHDYAVMLDEKQLTDLFQRQGLLIQDKKRFNVFLQNLYDYHLTTAHRILGMLFLRGVRWKGQRLRFPLFFFHRGIAPTLAAFASLDVLLARLGIGASVFFHLKKPE